MIFPLLLSSLAAAVPVNDGLQAQILPEGYDFLASQLTGTTWDFGPTEIVTEFECYDAIVVENLNFSMNLSRVSLAPADGAIDVGVEIGQLRGENMNLSGSSGWIDVCLDFDQPLKYLELADGQLTGEAAARVERGAVQLYFPAPLELTGDIDSELYGFPDDLAWFFLEGVALDMVADLIAEELPPVVAELTAAGFALPEIGGVETTLVPREARATLDGLFAAVDVDLGGEGGTGGNLDLSPRGTSHVAVGVTGALAEEILQIAWIEGLLSNHSEVLAPLIDDLLVDLQLDSDVEVFLGLAAPPAVAIDEDGIFVALRGLKLELHAPSGERLLALQTDATGRVDARLANGTIVLDVPELQVDVQQIETNLLKRDSSNLEGFLEGWVIDVARRALTDLEVYASHFEALGYVLRVDDREYQSGGMVVWASLYEADDPRVDRVPPDTEAAVEAQDEGFYASWQGTDDRAGPLTYRYRVDGGSWSAWTEALGTDLEVDDEEVHTLEVVARDGWANEDTTPASVSFVLRPATVSQGSTCGCGLGPAEGAGPAALAGLALALLLSRRRAAGRSR